MKRTTIPILVLGLISGVWAADEAALIQTQRGKMSYGLGMDIGRNITNQQIQVDPDALAAGIKAILTGAKPLLTDQEAQEAINALRAELQAKRAERIKQQAERAEAQAEQNKKDSAAFLAENKKKEGVITLASGLQYKVFAEGTGRKPTTNDTVIAHYRGTFIDGKEFDSSYRKGEPATFAVNAVIRGWQEALQLMPVGSKWRLFIPPELAYGESGYGNIPPNAALIFDLELLGIADSAATNKAAATPPAK
jgi:FKBP-type peptidyl-prolyl cis-trans isomerase FklB